MLAGRVTLNLGLRFDRYKSFIPDQHQLAFEIFQDVPGGPTSSAL